MVGREPPSVKPAERGKVRAEFRCARLYYLLTDFERLREAVEFSLEAVAAFLQGLFDAEGSICRRRDLRLYNTDFLLLCYAQKLLSKLRIETTGPYTAVKNGSKLRANGKVYQRKRDVYYIYVRARSLKTFYEKVGFRLPRKRRRLEEAFVMA